MLGLRPSQMCPGLLLCQPIPEEVTLKSFRGKLIMNFSQFITPSSFDTHAQLSSLRPLIPLRIFSSLVLVLLSFVAFTFFSLKHFFFHHPVPSPSRTQSSH